MELSSITPTPAALKALAHPVRLRMLGLLRVDGPATATTLATRLGINTGATSYHLRQLAQHGFVIEDSERGNARDRWWKAAHQSTFTDRTRITDPAGHETLDAYIQAVAVVHTQQLQGAIEEQALLPQEWRDASTVSDYWVRLTPRRARALVERLHEVLGAVDEDDTEDAADFVLQLQAFPLPGVPAEAR
ncbi:MAG: helix-turn-helix domain-containing protein [Actinomycetota bacterium]|nr:helix-turn-helix domain-containing protein [Actinomycetota bacterium]